MTVLRQPSKIEKQLIQKIRRADRRRDGEEVTRLLRAKELLDRARVNPA